jgi:hypothetical protein
MSWGLKLERMGLCGWFGVEVGDVVLEEGVDETVAAANPHQYFAFSGIVEEFDELAGKDFTVWCRDLVRCVEWN